MEYNQWTIDTECAFYSDFEPLFLDKGADVSDTKTTYLGHQFDVIGSKVVDWKKLKEWDKPFLCAFSDSDPVMAGVDKTFIKLIPGTKGMPHTTIEKAGHFLQEDNPEDCVKAILSI